MAIPHSPVADLAVPNDLEIGLAAAFAAWALDIERLTATTLSLDQIIVNDRVSLSADFTQYHPHSNYPLTQRIMLFLDCSTGVMLFRLFVTCA